MGNLYVDTGGNAANSGSTNDTSPLTGASATAAASTTVTLDAGTVLTSVVISGQNQSTINLAGTSVGNRTIYWITGTAGSGGATPTVTIDTAVTCAGVAWRIGGQYLWPSAGTVNVMEGALGLGLTQDVLQFNNSPASKTVTYLTARVAGDSTKGSVRIIGKAGVRPVLNITNTVAALTLGQSYWQVENLEIQQNGASGNAFSAVGLGIIWTNIKISDAGGIGFAWSSGQSSSMRVLSSEVSGVGSDGMQVASNSVATMFGNYIHDNGGNGISATYTAAPVCVIQSNIVDTNTGRGIIFPGALAAGTSTSILVSGNTVYGNGDSGIEVTDQDVALTILNNILLDNGNAGTEYNVEWVAGQAEFIGIHGWNCFSIAGGTGGGNVSGLTVNSTEITSSPQFVNAAGGDFRLLPGSPARATGFPGVMLGGSTGYLDMGAIQMRHPFATTSLHGIDNGIAA